MNIFHLIKIFSKMANFLAYIYIYIYSLTIYWHTMTKPSLQAERYYTMSKGKGTNEIEIETETGYNISWLSQLVIFVCIVYIYAFGTLLLCIIFSMDIVKLGISYHVCLGAKNGRDYVQLIWVFDMLFLDSWIYHIFTSHD